MTRTNAFTLLCVAIRVFALWLAIGLVLMLPALIMNAGAVSGDLNPWLLVIPVAVGLLVAAALWLFADKLSRLALTKPGDHVFESDLDASTWFGIALACIGAWHFIGGLLDAVQLAGKAMVFASQRAQYPSLEMQDSLTVEVVVAVLQLAIGAALVLRGRGIAAVLHRLRYAGGRQASAGD